MTPENLRRFLSFSKLQPIDCFNFLVISAVEISLRRPNMTMTHQPLNGFEIYPCIQQGSPKSMPHCVRSHSLPNEGFATGSLDQAANRPGSEGSHRVRAMLSQVEENRVIGVRSVLSSPPVLLYGFEGFNF